jgi:hypothetical protein
MKQSVKYLAVKLTALSGVLISPYASAWVPCQLLCDTQCIGTEMATKALEHAQKMVEIQTAFIESTSRIQGATQQAKLSSNDVKTSWEVAANDVEALLLQDKALDQSQSTRVAEAIRAVSDNLDLQNSITRETTGAMITEFQNSVSGSVKATLAMLGDQYIRSQTADLSDEAIQNGWEISKRHLTRVSTQNDIIQRAALYSAKLNTVSGQTSKLNQEAAKAKRSIADLLFQVSQLDEDSWRSFGFLDNQSSVAAYIDYALDLNAADSDEFTNLDYSKLKLGSHIDLQGLRLLKMQRQNLYLMETLNATKHARKEDNL